MDTSRIPHPPRRVPVLGDVRGVSPRTPVQDSLRLGRDLGPVFVRRFLSRETVFISDPDLVAELADEQRYTKHVGLGVAKLRAVGGDGLFTAYSSEPNWQRAHDILAPAFTREAMHRYHPVMLDVARRLLASWDANARAAEARSVGSGAARSGAGDSGAEDSGAKDSDTGDGSAVDVSADMTRLTLETIARTGFGYEFGSFERDRPHPFVSAMLRTLRHAQRQNFRLPLLGRALGRRADRRNAADIAYLREQVDQVIAARQAPGETGASDPADRTDTPDTPDTPDLLGLMLEHEHPRTGERLDPVNVRHQVLTFLVAGHETTSGALSFALYYLVRNPAVLAAAQAEVDRVWGANDDPDPDYAAVGKLRYVRRVVDEALRLWPTAPAFSREAREETVLGGRYRMTKGDWVVVLTPLLHRDPGVWGPNAEDFDPDRFAPGAAKKRPPHAYKPFGTGARACIGRQFALHEATLVLGLLLHRYDLRPADPAYRLRVTELLTVKPDGFRLRLRHRTPADRPPDVPAPEGMSTGGAA